MARLEDLKNGAMVKGVAPNQPVELISVEWIGDQAINIVFRDPNGSVSETTLYRDDEHRLQLVQGGRLWSFDADGEMLRLVTEAKLHAERHRRIDLDHQFNTEKMPRLQNGRRSIP